MVLLEFSMAPLTQGESVSAYVARSLDIIDMSGLPYQLTPMGTNIKIDYRAGPGGRLQSKLESVQRKLGRPLAT